MTNRLTGRGGLQPALFGDFQKGEPGLVVDQLQDPNPMLVGEGFRDDGQVGQGIGIMHQAHEGFNLQKRKRMRSKTDIFSGKTPSALQGTEGHGSEIKRGKKKMAIRGKLKGGVRARRRR